MNAVADLAGLTPRSIIEERSPRPPVIGKIRLGTQVLSREASRNTKAVSLYNEMLSREESFDSISQAITSQCNIRNPLAQKNTPHFICRRSDFNNPDVADEILRLYGEDHGDGRKLWKFDAIFAFDDWLRNVPNELAVWLASGRAFFSEYDESGTRYCKRPAKPELDQRSKRAKRTFGGRTIEIRRDDDIPDGVCEPLNCPQYQSNVCNMTASFFFVVPEIKGLGLIEMPTRSIYAVIKARAALETVASARGGKIAGTRFTVQKHNIEISRIKDGMPTRQMQWIPILDSKIDLGALLERREQDGTALERANSVVAALTSPAKTPPSSAEGSPSPADVTGTDQAPNRAAETGLQNSGVPPQEVSIDELRTQGNVLLASLCKAAPRVESLWGKYAIGKYGKGWTKRLESMLDAVADLQAALSCPEDFVRTLEAGQP
ncbi:Phage portal protein (plasmid) [Pararobbsia alpina]|uniref:recombination directionality factor n=1 Tax=Pararobbsia alpina TaxID=621374 RepID=UPI0039A59CA5